MGKWEMVRLGDVCQFINGDRGINYPSSNDFCETGIPFINAGHLEDDLISFDNMNYISEEKYDKLGSGKVQDGDLLYCLRGSLGKQAVVRGVNKGAIASSLVIIRPKNININFLRYSMKTTGVLEQQNKFNNGSSQPNLSASSVKSYVIPLPQEDVQQKIADILDLAGTLIEKRKAQIAKLDLLVKSQFVAMFGDPVINPMGWEVKTIGSCTNFQGGSQPPKSVFVYKKQEGYIRLIQIRDYKSDRFLTYIPQSMARKFCKEDDIMIGRYGPPLFQVLKGLEGAYNVALMKAVPNGINREYLRFYLSRSELLKYLEGFSQRTAGQDGVDMEMLKNYPLPLPPLTLQTQFAAFVEQVEAQKAKMKRGFALMELEYKSLMQKCFRGEIF